jgi:hypothetical protein
MAVIVSQYRRVADQGNNTPVNSYNNRYQTAKKNPNPTAVASRANDSVVAGSSAIRLRCGARVKSVPQP